MPRVKFTPSALRDIDRLRAFLQPVNPSAARRAAEAILRGVVDQLRTQPRMGRTVNDLSEEFREWVIPFGDAGYVARYQIAGDGVTILAVRHQREARF